MSLLIHMLLLFSFWFLRVYLFPHNLICCYQPSCVVSQQSWIGHFCSTNFPMLLPPPPGLKNTPLFPALTQCDDLYIHDLDSLPEIGGFNSLTSTSESGRIWLRFERDIEDRDGNYRCFSLHFPSERIRLQVLPVLSTISGFSSLVSMGDASALGSPAIILQTENLKSFTAFSVSG